MARSFSPSASCELEFLLSLIPLPVEDNLEDQALGAVQTHYDNTEEPDDKDLQRLAQFQHTRQFFSSDELSPHAPVNAFVIGAVHFT
jgi:hypothetical protein